MMQERKVHFFLHPAEMRLSRLWKIPKRYNPPAEGDPILLPCGDCFFIDYIATTGIYISCRLHICDIRTRITE